MVTRHQKLDAALQAVYDQIPEIPDCDGRCWTSCGPIEMSPRERQRIRTAGYKITDFTVARAKPQDHWCEALTADKRCAVYELRPLICRIWGVVEGLRCPFGCRPAGGWLPDEEGIRLLADAMLAGGAPEHWERVADRLRSNPALHQLMRQVLDRGSAGDRRRAARHEGHADD